MKILKLVSVPSFGDSFFIGRMKISSVIGKLIGFRPLIRGFFFYVNGLYHTYKIGYAVSVPSFGDSFFIIL